MCILLNKELLINGDFENGTEGWEAVNLCLKETARDAYFDVISEPKFNHIITESDNLIKGRYAHFRTGNIHTWLTLKEGIFLPAGEYVWSFAVKTYSTHIMFGIYSSKEVGCDDRLLPAKVGSSLEDSYNDNWDSVDQFIEISGKYQKQWDEENLPVYTTIKYCFTLERNCRVFPAIRGRSEAAVNSNEDVGVQSLYIDGMSLICKKLFEDESKIIDKYKADFIIEQPVHDKSYAGLSAVFPCFWFVPDKTMQRNYTEEEIRISTNKFLQMGVSIVRCLSLEPAYCWDVENKRWDWDSEWISGFYKYCDIMQKNDIDVIVNTVVGVTGYTSYLGLENPLYFVAKANNPKLFDAYDNKNVSDEQRAAIAKEFGKWLVDFYNEVVIKRGYTCVKYFEHGTEPNNGMESKTLEQVRKGFSTWAINLKACHDAVENAGIRDNIKFVGPSVVHADEAANPWTAQQWLKWCVEEYDYAIDIYAAHIYGFPYVMGDDISQRYYDFSKKCIDIVKKTSKPFWHDEFNVLTDFGIYRESAEHPLHATQIALGQLCTMLSGSSTTMLWYPVDIKWPNRNDTCFPSWDNGVHIVGLDKSILSGDAVPRYGYYVYCMLGTAIRSGDTVYKAKFDKNNQLYSILLKHDDGSYSIITVNMSNDENTVIYNFKEKKDIIFSRLVYDPYTFELPQKNDVGICIDEFEKATVANKIILPSDEIIIENEIFMDKIGPFQVVVYNQK